MNKKLKTETVDQLFDGILCLQNRDECYSFFEDLCTINELLSLSQRYEVATMLREKKTYLDIENGIINKEKFSYLFLTNIYFNLGMILVFVVLFITLIAIITLSKCLLIVSIILLLLAFLFVLAVAVFIFIGIRVRNWNEYEGCNNDYKGIYSAWSAADIYIQAVDEIFCSKRCPCYFNRTTEYKFLQNTTIAPYISQWTYTNNSANPKKFQDCEDQEVKDAYNKYLMR